MRGREWAGPAVGAGSRAGAGVPGGLLAFRRLLLALPWPGLQSLPARGEHRGSPSPHGPADPGQAASAFHAQFPRAPGTTGGLQPCACRRVRARPRRASGRCLAGVRVLGSWEVPPGSGASPWKQTHDVSAAKHEYSRRAGDRGLDLVCVHMQSCPAGVLSLRRKLDFLSLLDFRISRNGCGHV